ncbi:MAG: hypothetical protein MJZ03_03890 [archaeon]|nr:hypothetical protein [archaeon]
MATTKITNTQIDTLVKTAYAQATGQEGADVQIDLTNFTETGAYGQDFTLVRERFTGALIALLAKNFFLDSAYNGENDPFYVDKQKFGAITQLITMKAPEVREASNWTNFVSGQTTIGSHEIYLPIVETKLMAKTTSWELPVAISGSQWDDAVKSEGEFNNLVSYVMLAVQNALEQHKEDMNAMNRNNFIAEKINAQNTSVAGTHAVNLVKEYADSIGETTMTVEDFLSNADALRFASERIKTYIRYMKKQTANFNTKGRVTFVPEDRLVVELLGTFVDKVESKMTANTFHDTLVALPNYVDVASWQSLETLDFDGVSTINVKTADGNQVEKAGVIGLIADKWAVMHTIRDNRVGHMRDDIMDIDDYRYQFRDQYMNNLECSALVLMLDDVVA